ncbi:MAG: glutathione transferase GstA [Rhodospirillaceae bacterium]|nr:glutathione transferase GstA [Rhodospirillales bacterium]
MKLYYTPGACSLASHIVAVEAGLPLHLSKVDLKEHKCEDGSDFNAVNPKGYIPALVLDNGETLTEGVAIMQYLADQSPASGLAPAVGTMARYRLQEWLTFISSEVHKGFGPLWNPTIPEEVKQGARDRLARRFTWLDQELAARTYLMGDTFTAADSYLFTVVNWCGFHNVDLAPYANLRAYMDRVRGRAKVQQAMKEEGLV